MLVGAIAACALLWKRFGASVPALTLVRVIAAGAAAGGVGRFLKMESKLMTIVEAGIVGVTFLIVLVATGELGKKDLAAFAGAAKRRKG
jgi:hypothetical protein